MCGIIGVLIDDSDAHVNQLIFDALTVLQHRGQDAAGMVTTSSKPRARIEMRKDNGLTSEVFSTEHMAALVGNVGIGHVRYPTAGTKSLCAEAQPLFTNYPHGLAISHNGTLTNTPALRTALLEAHRHVNTGSDSEVLLNVLATELETALKHSAAARSAAALTAAAQGAGAAKALKESAAAREAKAVTATRDDVFAACSSTMAKLTGGYACVVLVVGVGLLGFRDPHGIRPLVYGAKLPTSTDAKTTHVLSSESVAIDALGGKLVRDVAPGECVLVGYDGQVHWHRAAQAAGVPTALTPCVFEYVYFARPDSVMDGVPVYESRLRMGAALARKIMREHPNHGIDVVIPVPETSRASALQCAYALGVPFREGFIKNRYIARTFIMPGQAARKKSVRLKLNCIKSEFAGKNVLLVDDSIVRGTTAREIVDMARECEPKKVFFTSAAPAIKFPNVYGIDIPTRKELVAHNRTVDQVAATLGVDWLIYQDLADLEESVKSLNPAIDAFESSCFSGCYVTPEVTPAFLESLEASTERAKEGHPDPPAYAAATSDAAAGSSSNGSSSNGGGSKAPLRSEGDRAAGNCEGVNNAAKKAKASNGSHIL